MTSSDRFDTGDFRLLSRAIASRPLVVPVTIAVCLALALFHARVLQDEMYFSDTVVRVVNAELLNNASSSLKVNSEKEVSLGAVYASSTDFQAIVESRLGRPLKGVSVDVEPISIQDALLIRVDALSPTLAQTVARTFSETYVDERRTAITQDLVGPTQELHDQLDRLTANVAEIDERIDALDRSDLSVTESEQLKTLQASRLGSVTRLTELRQTVEHREDDLAARRGQFQILVPARLHPSPYSPKPLRDGVVGAALGAFFGLVIAVIWRRLANRVETVDDLREVLPAEVPIIPIPVDERDASSRRATPFVAADTTSPGAEAFRSLRAHLLFRNHVDGATTVLVTSPSAGEGTTTVATNLALIAGMTGRRVLVLDLNLYQPGVHTLFGLSNEKGFTSVVQGAAPLGEVVLTFAVGAGQLHVLPAGPVPPNPAEMLLSKQSVTWFEALRDRYDVVICDLPPILTVADAVSLAPLFRGVIVVSRARSTGAPDLVRAVAQMQSTAVPLIAVVLNCVPGGATQYAGANQIGGRPARSILSVRPGRAPQESAAPSPKR